MGFEKMCSANTADIRRTAYNKFQLWWLISHGKSIEDIFALIPEWLEYRDEEDPEDTFSNWFFDIGFNDELFPCMDEFLCYEYRDQGLMKTLLSDEEYLAYCEDLHGSRRKKRKGEN